jgi:sugar (pentulose or hexulose) kinase
VHKPDIIKFSRARDGERTPDLPKGTGVYHGLGEETFKAGHMARAAMEGVTMGLNYDFNRLKALGVEPAELRLTGARAERGSRIRGCAPGDVVPSEGARGRRLHQGDHR